MQSIEKISFSGRQLLLVTINVGSPKFGHVYSGERNFELCGLKDAARTPLEPGILIPQLGENEGPRQPYRKCPSTPLRLHPYHANIPDSACVIPGSETIRE
jgi:hypothetical protein